MALGDDESRGRGWASARFICNHVGHSRYHSRPCIASDGPCGAGNHGCRTLSGEYAVRVALSYGIAGCDGPGRERGAAAEIAASGVAHHLTFERAFVAADLDLRDCYRRFSGKLLGARAVF